MRMNSDVLCGGKVNRSNYSAPKEIKSKRIVKFCTGFFHSGDYGPQGDATYNFKIESDENGILILSEYFKKGCVEVDESVMDGIQSIITKYNLVQFNGRNTTTYGLPAQFSMCVFSAVYDSGEKIEFSFNGDPRSPWTGEIRDYLADVFAKHGVDCFLPPKETQIIKRFILEYTVGCMRYHYGEMLVPVKPVHRSLEDIATNGFDEENYVEKYHLSSWNRSEDKEEHLTWDKTDTFYEELQKIVVDTELKNFANGASYPIQFDYKETPQYYHFYIEYEYGNRMSGFSDNVQECEQFSAVAEKFAQYFERNKG